MTRNLPPRPTHQATKTHQKLRKQRMANSSVKSRRSQARSTLMAKQYPTVTNRWRHSRWQLPARNKGLTQAQFRKSASRVPILPLTTYRPWARASSSSRKSRRVQITPRSWQWARFNPVRISSLAKRYRAVSHRRIKKQAQLFYKLRCSSRQQPSTSPSWSSLQGKVVHRPKTKWWL